VIRIYTENKIGKVRHAKNGVTGEGENLSWSDRVGNVEQRTSKEGIFAIMSSYCCKITVLGKIHCHFFISLTATQLLLGYDFCIHFPDQWFQINIFLIVHL
jgi:hypothetical protein